MRKLVLVLMTAAVPFGIASANVQAASNHLKVTQIKVCLTPIGWCTDYTLARSPHTTVCYCQHHQQTVGHVTSRIGILPSVPSID
ncbi:MAG: hypothetical protein ACM3MH_03970 [Actinomycetota bacterium]